MSNEPFAIETSTIGMVIWNPTNEDFDMQYAGVSMTMKAGEERAFEINCAKHLLNSFGQRGLTSLVYGCTEETRKRIGEEAVQRNLDFKKKQVVEYNQRNESRKQMGMGYLPPTEHVKKYAQELKIKLLEPFAVRDEERAAIAQTTIENESLKKRLADQEQEMAEIKEMMKTFMSGRKTEPEEDDKAGSGLRVRKDGRWVKE